MNSTTANTVCATYKNLVEPEFAIFFEGEIYPNGFDNRANEANPLYKKINKR